jgi:hypothetical protein
MDLKMFPHKISLVHKLPGQKEEMKLFSTHFSDKVYFYLDGTVNKQNTQL